MYLTHFRKAITLGLPLCAVYSQASMTSRTSTRYYAQNVVYWGSGALDRDDLSSYCTPDSGIDIIVLAFLNKYGNGNEIASGVIGQCSISSLGEPENCDNLASQIRTCKDNGVKVILSLGGAVGSYSLSSKEEAEAIGQNLWDAYGNTQRGSVPRPFGSTFVDGWDLDIELTNGNDDNYQHLIHTLRSKFATDSSNTYYITGAPQCPIPEPNMQAILTNAKFDYLWIQFYNNPGCSGNGDFNYKQWISILANTPSADAKLFIGVPASPRAAAAQYYLEPDKLAKAVRQYADNPAFGGLMMWSAGYSDGNVKNECTYAQQAKSILTTGSPCGVLDSSTNSSSNTLGTYSTPPNSLTALTSLSMTTPYTQLAGYCGPGAVICAADGKSWSTCVNGSPVYMGSVAAGTLCRNGALVNIAPAV